MAHYAILDENNVVLQVIVGKNEDEICKEIPDWEIYYGAKRTSYNTRAGIHLLGKTPFRKNFAGIGYFYDQQKDAFIPPKLFSSFILNEFSCIWEPPIEMPMDGHNYYWSEEDLNWIRGNDLI